MPENQTRNEGNDDQALLGEEEGNMWSSKWDNGDGTFLDVIDKEINSPAKLGG